MAPRRKQEEKPEPAPEAAAKPKPKRRRKPKTKPEAVPQSASDVQNVQESREFSVPAEDDIAGWHLLGTDPKARRAAILHITAARPHTRGSDLAKRFAVNPHTISIDLSALRAAAGLAWEEQDKAEFISEHREKRDAIYQAALEDAEACPPSSPVRATHRNTALDALRDDEAFLFKTGYLKEAPKQIDVHHPSGVEREELSRAITAQTLGIWRLMGRPELAALLDAGEDEGEEQPPTPGEVHAPTEGPAAIPVSGPSAPPGPGTEPTGDRGQ